MNRQRLYIYDLLSKTASLNRGVIITPHKIQNRYFHSLVCGKTLRLPFVATTFVEKREMTMTSLERQQNEIKSNNVNDKATVSSIPKPLEDGYNIEMDWAAGSVSMTQHQQSAAISPLLEETQQETQTSFTSQSLKESSSLCSTTGTASHNNTPSTPSTISESTLQFQRQLRKMQAANRASQPKSYESLIEKLALSKTTTVTTMTPSSPTEEIKSHNDVVIYVDEHIIVVNKPSGLLSVPGLNHNPSMLSLVFDHYPPTSSISNHKNSGGNKNSTTVCDGDAEKVDGETKSMDNIHDGNTSFDGHDNTNGSKRKHNKMKQAKKKKKNQIKEMTMEHMVVHRLDMDTSGILVFARTLHAMSHLQSSFREKSSSSTTSSTSKKKKKHPSKSKRREQQEQQQMNKTYEALVIGHIHPQIQSGKIDLPLQRDHKHPPFMRVSTPQSEYEASQVVKNWNDNKMGTTTTGDGTTTTTTGSKGFKKLIQKKPKESVTLFRVLKREWYTPNEQSTSSTKDNNNNNDNTRDTDTNSTNEEENEQTEKRFPVTRVELTPITGRTHQLRVHCSAIGHPILGDPAYGFMGEACPNGGVKSWDSIVLVVPDHDEKDNKECELDEEKQQEEGNRIGFLEHRASVDLLKNVDEATRKDGLCMCLHARELGVIHPVSEEEIVFKVAPKF